MQLPHLERAHGHATAAAAKEAGNAHFKAGEYPDAAACYARALRANASRAAFSLPRAVDDLLPECSNDANASAELQRRCASPTCATRARRRRRCRRG